MSSAVASGDATRRRQLLLFAAGALGLLLAAVFAFTSRSAAAVAALQREATAASLVVAREQHSAAERLAAEAERASTLLAQAAASGWRPSDWGERRINLHQARLPREAVEEMLQTTARGPGRIFGAETFDLSVTRMDEGLFERPDAQSQPLQLTLRGAHYFRTRD